MNLEKKKEIGLIEKPKVERIPIIVIIIFIVTTLLIADMILSHISGTLSIVETRIYGISVVSFIGSILDESVGKVYTTIADTSMEENRTSDEIFKPREWILRREKFGRLSTGIEGRHVNVMSLTHGTKFSGSVLCVMDNFLLPEECRQIIAEANRINPNPEKSNDLYGIGAAGVTSTRLAVNSDDGQIFTKMRKMILPFMSDKTMDDKNYISTIKKYDHKSRQLGIVPHYDGSEFTLLVYLTDVDLVNMGATVFGDMGIKIQPRQGRAIWFKNYRNDKEWGNLCDYNMEHSGEPVLDGEKIIMQFLS